MFVLTIREMMAQKGIKPRVFELFKRGIGRSSAMHYLSGNAKSIKLDDLFTLCLTLNCTPKELMRVQVDDPQVYKKQPIFDWTPAPSVFPLEEIMMLTPTQMVKAQEVLRAIINEGKENSV